ncbi:hypothetical protein EKI60_06415 [Candidatus Saccharibacteria bacterium]|nr:MAG: hypothetical protein EKI60_06415 [Candidatus Saccharibacteria bacterium]
MGFGGALLALSAVQGISQIGQGYAQKAESNFNATLAEGKANLIGAQSEIEQGQYQRLKGQYLSKSTAAAAGAGIMPSGSAAAVMLDAQTQINIDQAIAKFNREQEQSYTRSQADAYRRQGKQSVYSGYSNAFSTMLSGASNYAMYKGSTTKPKTSFDTSAGAKFSNTSIYNKPNMSIFR